jgi:putative hemin transport protein
MPDDSAALLARFEAFGAGLPHPPHARDVAAALGVSEGALCEARRLSGAAVPLRRDWAGLLRGLPGCGPLMALSRNAHCVSEIDGAYAAPAFDGDAAWLAGRITLWAWLDRWHAAYALTEPTRSGLLTAIQIFDRQGDAVHKVYQAGGTDRAAFDALIDALSAPDADPSRFAPPQPPMPTAKAGRSLAPQALRWVLERAAESALPVTITVGNAGVTQQFFGTVETIKVTGPWVNVLDPAFNLHLREDRIAQAAEVGEGIEVSDAEGLAFCRIAAGDAWSALAADAPTP